METDRRRRHNARMPALPTYDQVHELPSGPLTTIPPEYGDPNGHLNVRNYLGLFDDAEWALFDPMGLGAEHAEQGLGGVFALEQHLTYRREVGIGDVVQVHVRPLARSESLLHLVSYLRNETRGEVAASMESLDGYVDFGTRRLGPMPTPAGQALDRMIAAVSGLDWQPTLSGSIRIG